MDWHLSIRAPAPIALVADNCPCFRGTVLADAFTGGDPLLRHVRTRVRSPQTNGVVERFFGTLKYEHLYPAIIGDGNALAVEVSCFRHTPCDPNGHSATGRRGRHISPTWVPVVIVRASVREGSACVRGSQTMPMSFGWIWGQEE